MLPWKRGKFKLIISVIYTNFRAGICWFLLIFITPTDGAGSHSGPWIDADMESAGFEDLLDTPTGIVKTEPDIPGRQEMENLASLLQFPRAYTGAMLLHEFIPFQFQTQFHDKNLLY